MIKISDKNYKQFVKWCRHYQRLFGLMSYNLWFEHTNLSEYTYASIKTNVENATVTLWFNTEMGDYCQRQSPRETAKHEMLHILAAKLVHCAKERITTQEQIDIEWEHLTVTLQGLID